MWYSQSFTRCKQSVSRIVQSVSHTVQSVSNAHTRSPSSFNRSVLSHSNLSQSRQSVVRTHTAPSHTRPVKTIYAACHAHSVYTYYTQSTHVTVIRSPSSSWARGAINQLVEGLDLRSTKVSRRRSRNGQVNTSSALPPVAAVTLSARDHGLQL